MSYEEFKAWRAELGYEVECNLKLLQEIRDRWGTQSDGHREKFFQTSADWQCPSCMRNKDFISRIDKNGKVLIAIHDHHDHFEEYVFEKMNEKIRVKPSTFIQHRKSLEANVVRFPRTLICGDCNVADGAVKRKLGLVKYFSFAPHEISLFINPKPHSPHEIDYDLARKIYESQMVVMRLLCKKVLDKITQWNEEAGFSDNFEHVGVSAEKVIKDLKK